MPKAQSLIYHSAIMSLTRRHFLQAVTAAMASAGLPRGVAAQPTISMPVPGILGLELYSVRHQLDKDVPGTLKLVRSWGFEQVEGGNFYGRSAADFKALLAQHGLQMQSMLVGYEQLRDDLPTVMKNARAIGATLVGTAWIPHEQPFTRQHVDMALADFAKWGKAMRAEGLRFFYHVHGYEFAPSPDGTLMDTLVKNSPADAVDFQADVFWVKRGGGDPAGLLTKYPGRFKSVHLKDMAKGVATNDPTGSAPDETCVVIGTGQLDFQAILRAAKASGVTHYYIEDEHPSSDKQIPQSLKYLSALEI